MIQRANADRVRAHTSPEVNADLDHELVDRVRTLANASPDELEDEIDALEREWDIERVLEMNASVLALAGVALALLRHRRWLYLPAAVLSFLFQHSAHGWCPPIPVLRRMGFRTRKEIDRERYALKALRGDFAAVAHVSDPERRMRLALQAVGVRVP